MEQYLITDTAEPFKKLEKDIEHWILTGEVRPAPEEEDITDKTI
jgi:hypothetical protein